MPFPAPRAILTDRTRFMVLQTTPEAPDVFLLYFLAVSNIRANRIWNLLSNIPTCSTREQRSLRFYGHTVTPHCRCDCTRHPTIQVELTADLAMETLLIIITAVHFLKDGVPALSAVLGKKKEISKFCSWKFRKFGFSTLNYFSKCSILFNQPKKIFKKTFHFFV